MDAPVYSEKTPAPAWILVILWGSVAVVVVTVNASLETLSQEDGRTLASWTTAGLVTFASAVTLLFARLDVDVHVDRVVVAFGPARLVKRTISLDDVTEVMAVTYRPIRDFGGWGLRYRPGKTAWTTRGNRAVRLTLVTGKEVYLGSRFPHRLAERIHTARRRHGMER